MISPVAAWMIADVEVVDEEDDGGACEWSADADVEEVAVVAQGDFAGFVDAVGAESEVAVGLVVGSGFGACVVGDGGGGVMGERAVRSPVVVVVDEPVQSVTGRCRLVRRCGFLVCRRVRVSCRGWSRSLSGGSDGSSRRLRQCRSRAR